MVGRYPQRDISQAGETECADQRLERKRHKIPSARDLKGKPTRENPGGISLVPDFEVIA